MKILEYTLSWNECDAFDEVVEEYKDEIQEFKDSLKLRGYCECKIKKHVDDFIKFRVNDTWDMFVEELDNMMNDVNRFAYWYCKTTNNGWQRRTGRKWFKATGSTILLCELLPKTEFSIKVAKHKKMLIFNVSHHDSPAGGEMYYIIPGKHRWY